jgi:hypothetical protein
MSHVFDGARWISIPTGLLWAALVINLYLLLLYTISPALLPVANKKKHTKQDKAGLQIVSKIGDPKNPFLSFSFLTRVVFITFLAIIIAQPFNVCFFAPDFEKADKFAATIQEVLRKNPLSLMVTALFSCIMLLPVYFKYRVRRISGKASNNNSEASPAKGMRHLREQLSHTTDHQNLARQILSIDINSIRTSDFYFQKKLLEYRMILEEYEDFKIRYSRILTERNAAYNLNCDDNINVHLDKLKDLNPEKFRLIAGQKKEYLRYETIEKYEYWVDPPFRTVRSADRNLAKESDLLQTLYPDN